MLAGIIVARELGAAGRGTLSVLVALGSVSVLLGSFGIHYSAVYFIGSRPDDSDQVVSNVAVTVAAGSLITTAVLLAAVTLGHGALLGSINLDLFLLFIAVVPFSYFNEFAQRTLISFGKSTAYIVPDLFEGPILLSGTIACIVVFGTDIKPLILLRVLVEVVQAIFLALYAIRVHPFRFSPSWRLFRSQLSYGLRNYSSSLLWLFLLRSDLVLCNHFLGTAPTGIYSVSESLAQPLALLVMAMSVLLFHRTSAEPNRHNRIENMNRLMRLVTPVIVGAGITLALGAHWIVAIVYGPAYREAASALVLLVPGVVLMSLETMLMNFLSGEGSPLVVVWAPLIGLLLNLGVNIWAIPHFGIKGAAVTSTVGYAVVFGIILRYYCVSTKSPTRTVLLPRRRNVKGLR